MRLEDFRTTVAILSQRQLAQLSGVAPSTIYEIETGKRAHNKLTQGKILAGLSKHMGRPVQAQEIDEFHNDHD